MPTKTNSLTDEQRKQFKDTKKMLNDRGKKCKNYPTGTFAFLLQEYKICHEKATHYDRLSWVVGAFLAGASSLIAAIGLRVNGEVGLQTFLYRTPFALIAMILIWAWRLIYERNRGWVEMLNERIKDIERNLGIYGIGSYFSVGSWQMGMERENTERTEIAKKLKLDDGDGSVFLISRRAMHLILRLVVWGLTIVIVIMWLLPLILWLLDP